VVAIIINICYFSYQELTMSVRATERLIGDAVIVTALPNSPQMVVRDINEKTRIITTAWFSDQNEFQEGTFPASALDRVERAETKKPAGKAGKPSRGRPPRTKK
jgi:hypothetical protein